MLRCLLVCGYCRKADFFLSLPCFLSEHPFPPLPKEAGLNGQSFGKHLVTSLSPRDCAGCIGPRAREHLVPAIKGFTVKWGIAGSFQGNGGANTRCSWDHGRQVELQVQGWKRDKEGSEKVPQRWPSYSLAPLPCDCLLGSHDCLYVDNTLSFCDEVSFSAAPLPFL